MNRLNLLILILIFIASCIIINCDDITIYPERSYEYDVPVDSDSPWPSFRHDRYNSGKSPIIASYHGDTPWMYKTGKGIFSTPVIDSDGIVYVGSADYTFYAFNTDGSIKWQFKTGEMIDSAGTISEYDEVLGTKKIIFLSGDGNMYCRRADNGEAIWEFEVHDSETSESYHDWWEGNVVFGPDGSLYAGNTNWHYYSVNADDGTLNWKYCTDNNAWSATAFDDDGNIYWGSVDAFVHSVQPPVSGSTEPTVRWKKLTLGFVTASAAIGTDGTVYIGSFDSHMYALDPATGGEIWKTPTGDHIYASAALGQDASGNTNRIYFGSADGKFYALDAYSGTIIWTYDTGDVIRASAAIGRASNRNLNDIVYFGCGNGKLYALNAEDGARRWSFDTTPYDDPELVDRNDLNGSVALGETGVYIAGEHGYVTYVPYDYCLNAPDDDRCETDSGDEFEENVTNLYYVTSGGSIETEDPDYIDGASVITQQFVQRVDGTTLDTYCWNTSMSSPLSDSLSVTISPNPSISYDLFTSARGLYIFLVLDGILTPGIQYTISYSGNYFGGGEIIGNRVIGGYKEGSFTKDMTFTVNEPENSRIPLYTSANETTGLLWTRLSATLPPMLNSVNQIGFDSFNWMLGTIYIEEPDSNDEGRFIMWATAAKYDDDGVIIADPGNDNNRLRAPFNGRYKNDYFILTCENYTMSILNFELPISKFQLRGQLGDDLIVNHGANVYAEIPVADIPDYSTLLVLAGLANSTSDDLIAAGTYITRPYSTSGPANKRPDGLSVSSLVYTAPAAGSDGSIVASFDLDGGYSYPLDEHIPAIILVDTDEVAAVNIDYMSNIVCNDDAGGNLIQVTLTIPAGTSIPANTDAYVILDIFPFYNESL